jgi:hypothetical protein
MGFYIEVPMQQVGDHFNKADQLEAFYGAKRLPGAPDQLPDEGVLICVVQNRLFEAAGICYDNYELQVFADPTDDRPKVWLVMERSKVVELCPRVQDALGV